VFYESIKLEADYAHYCQASGPILGYSAADHIETAQFFANLKCQALGLPNLFAGAKHRFPWMSEAIELKKEKNFFETRVTEYRAGGALDFEEEEDDIFSHLSPNTKAENR